jgi:hypothetical protein
MIVPRFRHPFGVEALLEHSLVLAYAVPHELLAQRLPPYLEVDTYEGRLGFVAAAFVDTRQMRPQGFPAWIGRDFLLAGYRIFVRYRDARGRRLRGLYILRSETNRWQMEILGNLFTSYRYKHTHLAFATTPRTITISSPTGLLVESTIPSEDTPQLPKGSPFPSWKEARRYSGPLPFTFSFDSSRSEMVIVEGVREGWSPQPVTITHAAIPTLQELGFSDAILANAFLVRNIPYRWRAGVIERLPHTAPHSSGNTPHEIVTNDDG